MKQPPIKTKELSGSTVQIADGQNWEIASITAYGENAQGGTTEAPVALTGVDSVQVSGNNLFVNNAVTETKSGITFTVNTDRSITVNGTASTSASVAQYTGYNLTLPDGGYALSGTSSLTGVEVGARIKRANGDNEWFTVDSYLHTRTFNIATGDIIVSFYVLVRAGQTADNVTVYPMLNVGSTALPYEPYNGSITQLPIPRPLRRVGDVKDKCVTRQDYESAEKLVVTYNVGFVELDGTENWQWNSNTAWPYIATFLPNNKTGVAPVCSHYQGTGAVIPAANQVAINELGSLIIKDPSWKSVDDAKAYFASQKAEGTPVQIAYQFATPETYATDPIDFDNAAGPLTVMTGGEVEVTLTHRMLTPYTAWTIQYDSEGEYTGDFFNVEDYDRIKQNIEYLREYAYFLYGGFTLRGMVAVTVESYGYASTIDALDANLEAIAANTFRPPDMMPVKQWRGNQPPPGADDWNRIENTCLLLFEQFERQFACLPKLAFELKGSAF